MIARRRIAFVFLAVLCVGLLTAPGAVAKKGKKNANVFTKQLAVNAGIPDRGAGNVVSAALSSKITVPKAFKGRTVADVNVTGLQTTGSAAGSADELVAYLTGPGGRTLQLFFRVGAQSLGPWTLDDDTSVSICDALMPPCGDPNMALNRPFAGTSNLLTNWQGAFPMNGGLSIFNRQAMRGTWTLTIVDVMNNNTSTLNQWGLRIRATKVAK